VMCSLACALRDGALVVDWLFFHNNKQTTTMQVPSDECLCPMDVIMFRKKYPYGRATRRTRNSASAA
jgi:hypothetical protein